ncbi:MAG: flavin reductase [Planctomycetota bacterium]
MNNKTLYKIGYGMYIVSSKKSDPPDGEAGKFNGQVANTVFQLTSEPPTIAISINKKNLTYEYINTSKVFTVSILNKETPMEFIGTFGFKSGRDIDKFKDVKYKVGMTGAPAVIENTLGYLEAEVINSLDVGTHNVFVGKVVDAEIINETEPMTYDYYHEVKRGKAPPTAPTYIKETKEVEEDIKLKTNKSDLPDGISGQAGMYLCTVCGYVYNPEKGDPNAGIKPGTPFSELPDDWVCPICGQDKSVFEKIK